METLSTFTILAVVLMLVLSVLTVAINGIFIYIISKSDELSKSPSSYLMRNLLAVHFFQGMVVYPFYTAKKIGVHTLRWKRVICDGFRFSYMTSFYAAIFSILWIAIDRFIAVRFVMKYKRIMTKQRILGFISLLWLYVVVLCLIPFKSSNKFGPFLTPESHNSSSLFYNDTAVQIPIRKCSYEQTKLWTILMLVINCFLPYVIVVGIYQFIVYAVRQIERKTKAKSLCANKDIVLKKVQKHKAINRMSMILSFAYFLCWGPSVIYYVLSKACPESCFTEEYMKSVAETYIGFVVKYIAFLDALVSPLIYCLYNERFRKVLLSYSRKGKKEDVLLEMDANRKM